MSYFPPKLVNTSANRSLRFSKQLYALKGIHL
ncbi:hypothetical protein EZS27_034667, partial [termite gut metagenome]